MLLLVSDTKYDAAASFFSQVKLDLILYELGPGEHLPDSAIWLIPYLFRSPKRSLTPSMKIGEFLIFEYFG
jgi:hypothetical protein